MTFLLGGAFRVVEAEAFLAGLRGGFISGSVFSSMPSAGGALLCFVDFFLDGAGCSFKAISGAGSFFAAARARVIRFGGEAIRVVGMAMVFRLCFP